MAARQRDQGRFEAEGWEFLQRAGKYEEPDNDKCFRTFFQAVERIWGEYAQDTHGGRKCRGVSQVVVVGEKPCAEVLSEDDVEASAAVMLYRYLQASSRSDRTPTLRSRQSRNRVRAATLGSR